MSDTLTDVAEDRTLRHWTFRGPARVKIGFEAHKQMFCRMLLETHHAYKPAVLEWPPLPPDALARLCSLPIWDTAVQTEGRTSIALPTYAAQLRDPLLREAITMDGDEEARHKHVLSRLVPTLARFALRFMKPSRRDTPSGQGDAGHDMDRR